MAINQMFPHVVMTSKTIKLALFGALIVAMVLPFSGMNFATAQETSKAKQIEKPTESQFEKDTKVKVKTLFLERMALESNGKSLKDKYQKDGEKSLTTDEKNKLEKISKRLSEISAEFIQINTESQKLYAMTPQEKNHLIAQQQLVINSNIPFFGVGTDMRVGAITIGFESQEIADEFIPTLNEILSVPYYIEIGNPDVDLSCTNLNSDCDPLMGGIEIGTEKSSTWTTCSISVPIYRNVFWWTEEGFVTAAHCFENINGNDAKQPAAGAKVGDVTKTQNSGECDCAFVMKSSSESTLFGNWWGTGTSNQLLSKGDALLGDYVVMIGKSSGIEVGQVISTTYYASGISNMHKVNFAMAKGDSGGTVIDLATYNVYQGLIKGGNLSTYTSVVPWTHIDAALDLR